MAIITLVIILNPEYFIKKPPPRAVANNAGKVAIPKHAIASIAISGFEIAAAIKKAPYKSPQGMKPSITPRKYPLIPVGFLKRKENFLVKKMLNLSINGNLNGNIFLSNNRLKKKSDAPINKRAERILKLLKSLIFLVKKDEKKPIIE